MNNYREIVTRTCPKMNPISDLLPIRSEVADDVISGQAVQIFQDYVCVNVSVAPSSVDFEKIVGLMPAWTTAGPVERQFRGQRAEM